MPLTCTGWAGAASERLHAAIVEGQLRHPDNPHVFAMYVQPSLGIPRGWRIDKLKSRDNIDAVVAMAMAVEAAENRPAPVELIGWL